MNFKVFHIQESVERDHVEGGMLSKLKLLGTTKKYFFPFFLLNCLIVLVLLTGVSTMNVYANEDLPDRDVTCKKVAIADYQRNRVRPPAEASPVRALPVSRRGREALVGAK